MSGIMDDKKLCEHDPSRQFQKSFDGGIVHLARPPFCSGTAAVEIRYNFPDAVWVPVCQGHADRAKTVSQVQVRPLGGATS